MHSFESFITEIIFIFVLSKDKVIPTTIFKTCIPILLGKSYNKNIKLAIRRNIDANEIVQVDIENCFEGQTDGSEEPSD